MPLDQLSIEEQFAYAFQVLAQGVMQFPLADDGTIILVGDEPGTWDNSPTLEHARILLTAACQRAEKPSPEDVLDWLHVLSVPLVELDYPLPPALQTEETLLDEDGRPTAFAAQLAQAAESHA